MSLGSEQCLVFSPPWGLTERWDPGLWAGPEAVWLGPLPCHLWSWGVSVLLTPSEAAPGSPLSAQVSVTRVGIKCECEVLCHCHKLHVLAVSQATDGAVQPE